MDSRIPNALVLTIRDVDPDYLLVEVLVGDGSFAGRAQVYEDLELGSHLAAQLSGFPRSASDERAIVLGSFDPQHAGGALQLQLACLDRSGHARIHVRLLDQPLSGDVPRTLEALLPVEAASIDTFVTALRNWGPTVGDVAICAGAA